jgi:hypothetical protein
MLKENDFLDTNIENYSLDEILKLFKMTHTFDSNDLKRAKQMVLKTHPDKSGLDSSYFIFFSRAYKLVLSIYEFKKTFENQNNQNNQNNETNYDIVLKDTMNANINIKEKEKEKEKFNEWFNKEFEKHRFLQDEEKDGYGEWLKTDQDLFPTLDKASMEEAWANKKKELASSSALIQQEEGFHTASSFGSNLAGTTDSTYGYTSSLFSHLPYQDLKSAHTESLIPVSPDHDLSRKERPRTLQEYKQIRSVPVKPLSEQQSIEFLQKKDLKMERESTQTAYRLAQDLEKSKKANNQFLSSFLLLQNKK